MPTVQTYQPDQVRTQVAAPTRAQTSAIPQAMGDLAQGINSVAQMADKMSIEASFASAQEASTSFEREKNRIFFDPNNGYFNTQGKDAYDKAKGVTEQLEELRKQYGKDLDPRARQEFDRVAGAMLTRSNTDIMRHSSKNLEAWKMANTQAEVENTIENASLYWNNLKQLDVQSALGEASVLELAERQGLSPEATNEKLQTYRSSFASSVITSALSKSAGDAEKAMELWGESLEGPDLISLQEKIAERKEIEVEQSLAGESVLRANKLVSQFGDRIDARTAMQEEINKIKDPDMQKRVRSEATYQLNLKQQADEEERINIAKDMSNMLYNGTHTLEQLKATNSWHKLSAQQKQAFESPSGVKTDPVLWVDLKMMDPDKLKNINPSDYANKLEFTELNKLTDMVMEARKAPTEELKIKSTTGTTRAQITKGAIEQLFGDVDKNNRESVRAFDRLIDSEVRRQEMETGKEVTSIEYRDIVDRITRITYIEEGFFFDSNETLDEMEPEQMRTVNRWLTERGLPVTERNIRQALVDIEKLGN